MNARFRTATLERRNAVDDAAAHHFTVDVEEYFHASAFERHIEREQWARLPSRVVMATARILDLMAEFDARGTFFTLAWVAERQPALVRRIIAEGHELASHGTDHVRVTHLRPDDFRESVRRSKAVLEDISGAPVLGYRAPSFSIVPGLEWAFDILIEEGYSYDSSLNPIARKGAGYPGACRDPAWIEREAGRLLEVPVATLSIGGKCLPAGGGAWFRHFPYLLCRSGLRGAEGRGMPGTFYIHPWEVDEGQPRVAAPLRTQLRHYGGLERTDRRLRRLFSEFTFGPVADTLRRLA